MYCKGNVSYLILQATLHQSVCELRRFHQQTLSCLLVAVQPSALLYHKFLKYISISLIIAVKGCGDQFDNCCEGVWWSV